MKKVLFVFVALVALTSVPAGAQDKAVASAQATPVKEIVKTGETTVEVRYENGQVRVLDFYGPDIVRIFQDPAGGPVRDPEAKPEAKILVDNPRKEVSIPSFDKPLTVDGLNVIAPFMRISFEEKTGLMSIHNEYSRITEPDDFGNLLEIFHETASVNIENHHTVVHLSRKPDECFYGGGMQNGRFSHAGKIIQIVNTNNWTDGGVSSPTPFYWSTAGYSILFHTFRPGRYDFGATKPDEVVLSHDADYLDMFVMLSSGGDVLGGYYQLTGKPVLLPKFGFYEGHLNAYNRDYWTETEEGGVLFEDGKRYKESQKPVAGGIRESLNDELKDSLGRPSYQFSARAVIDRYAAHDMPLGWVLPNDGYGSGYGQTGSLEGNIDNLRQFGQYAHEHGVEVGLWTQSDLHPKEGVEPLLQRDIVGEIRDGGVRVLKTDVAWVGAGYSFGLNGVADVAKIMPEQADHARPFIITCDGWAGTQRYAGLWSGDQVGGQWEYIRFHIPTYIGSGLSGQPNVGSDMDGIFGGRNIPVNVRDFQWKTFTPMELNMDGWGANEKYPHALGKRAEDINRTWLKFKSALMPYTYSIAYEAAAGRMPMVRAMAWELDDVPRFIDIKDPDDVSDIVLDGGLVKNRQQIDNLTKYQFMYGPYFLVAPIYQDTKMDEDGNDIRNGIYLPNSTNGLEINWFDPYANAFIKGGCILNSYDAPLDRIPFFIRQGAIIPFTTPHNQPRDIEDTFRGYMIVPGGYGKFLEYDDDGITEAYLREGNHTETIIENNYWETNKRLDVTITIRPTTGTFEGFVPEKHTTLLVQAGASPKKITVKAGKKKVKAQTSFAHGLLTIEIPTMDVTKNELKVVCKGFTLPPMMKLAEKHGTLAAPTVTAETTAYTIKPSWTLPENADYAEIMFDGMRYTTLREGEFLFEELMPETTYDFQIRSVNADGTSEWASLSATTDANPLEFAIHGIKGTTSCPNQRGEGIGHFFDFDETTVWHTAWGEKAVPFTMDIDLGCTIQLDKLLYLPREDAGNGTLQEGTISYSLDGGTWSEPVPFRWSTDAQAKEMAFKGGPSVRYLRMEVTRGRGDFGSGRQLYVFRLPGSEILIPGDINRDGQVDMDDFTSYMNYNGLRKGDPEFDGYVSAGDINHDGRIDVSDISVVATQVRGGAEQALRRFAGALRLEVNKSTGQQVNKSRAIDLKAGETLTLNVVGEGLSEVNAFGFALPYNAADLEFVEATPIATKEMENITNDRLHANGDKVLYPTFVNTGDRPTLSGDGTLCTLTFRARRACKVTLTPQNIVLVDKMLNEIKD